MNAVVAEYGDCGVSEVAALIFMILWLEGAAFLEDRNWISSEKEGNGRGGDFQNDKWSSRVSHFCMDLFWGVIFFIYKWQRRVVCSKEQELQLKPLNKYNSLQYLGFLLESCV